MCIGIRSSQVQRTREYEFSRRTSRRQVNVNVYTHTYAYVYYYVGLQLITMNLSKNEFLLLVLSISSLITFCYVISNIPILYIYTGEDV